MPAWVRTWAAMPPTAPSPMMTTSAFGRSLLTSSSLQTVDGKVQRFDVGVDLLVGFGPDQLDAGVANQVPAGKVLVAAVNRVTEHPLPGVLQHESEGAYPGHRRASPASNRVSSSPVARARRRRSHRLPPRRRAPPAWPDRAAGGGIWAGKGAIDEDVYAGFVGAGTQVVGGNEATDDGPQAWRSLARRGRPADSRPARPGLRGKADPARPGLARPGRRQPGLEWEKRSRPPWRFRRRPLPIAGVAGGRGGDGSSGAKGVCRSAWQWFSSRRQPGAERDPCAYTMQ